MPDSKISTMFLPVPLTGAEKEDFKKRLLKSLDEADEIEAEKKASNDAFKHRLSENASNTDHWRRCLKEGAEHRQVEVRTEPRLAENKIVTYRVDSFEEVNFRAMTPNERAELEQERLDFEGAEDDTVLEGVVHTFIPAMVTPEMVEKEIASTYDSDPFAPDEAETSQRDPLEWRSLEDGRPAEDEWVETGLYSEAEEKVISQGEGYVHADTDEGWRHKPDYMNHQFGGDGSEEWEISHYRAAQPKADAPTEEGEAD